MLKDCEYSKQVECHIKHCEGCGWDPLEIERRKKLIRGGGLPKPIPRELAGLILKNPRGFDGLTCEEV